MENFKRKTGELKIKRLQAVMTEDEIFRLFGIAESVRDRLLLKALYYTGMRVSEVLNITKGDINYKESVIRIKPETSKTRREAMQPIPKPLAEELKRACEYMQDDQKLFPLTKQRVWQIVKYYTKKANINKEVHPHTFRHTYGTHIYEKTQDLGKVQELLRHQSLATTGIYKHLSKELKQKTVDDVFK